MLFEDGLIHQYKLGLIALLLININIINVINYKIYMYLFIFTRLRLSIEDAKQIKTIALDCNYCCYHKIYPCFITLSKKRVSY